MGFTGQNNINTFCVSIQTNQTGFAGGDGLFWGPASSTSNANENRIVAPVGRDSNLIGSGWNITSNTYDQDQTLTATIDGTPASHIVTILASMSGLFEQDDVVAYAQGELLGFDQSTPAGAGATTARDGRYIVMQVQ